jgi:hypothetical protein
MRPAVRSLCAGLPLALGGLLAFSGAAQAQIVNVQPLVAKVDREGPSGDLDASADWRSGNTDLLLLSGSVSGRYRAGRHLAFAFARGEYGVADGDRFASSHLEHLRYRVGLVEPLELEAFAQHDRDEFRRLSLRVVGGAGPRLHFMRWAPMDAAIGAAYLLEYEELDPTGDEPDAGETQLNHRLSLYLTMAIRFSDWLRLGYTLYVQPRFDDFEDVRVLSETELLISANKHLSFKLSLGVAADTEPPIGVRLVDAKRKASIQVSF